MGLTATKSSGSDLEQTPEGVYIGRCYRVVDLGTQETEFLGETKFQHKALVSWEILGMPGGDPAPQLELEDENGKKTKVPFTVHKRYTVSLDERSHLHKDLTSWRGRKFTEEEEQGFHLKNILGAYCQIQVIHNEKNGTTYANVDTVMKTAEKPDKVMEDVLFDIDEPDMQVFESLSDSLKKTIQASKEWRERQDGTPVNEEAEAAEADANQAEKDEGEAKAKAKSEDADLSDIPF